MLVLTATSTWALEDESFDSIPGPTITSEALTVYTSWAFNQNTLIFQSQR
jgi:hypothetical protein